MQKYRRIKCLYCEKEIEKKGNFQSFCSLHCKEAFHKDNDFCTYCGLEPFYRKSIIRDPICKECHSLIEVSKKGSVAEKAKMLLDIYQEKYKKDLEMIDWDEEDLQDMGQNMKSKIKVALKEKYKIEGRISWLKHCASHYVYEEDEPPYPSHALVSSPQGEMAL
jgi:hypothetical protein